MSTLPSQYSGREIHDQKKADALSKEGCPVWFSDSCFLLCLHSQEKSLSLSSLFYKGTNPAHEASSSVT